MKKNNYLKKKYDAAMFLQFSDVCNFKCEYCITKKNPKMQNPYKKIDLEKFSEFIDKLEKKFLFIYSGGGEPTLHPQIMEISKIVTEKGHFIAITSNMSTDVMEKIAKEINPLQIDYIIASAHTSELEKRNMLDRYFRTCLLFKNKGVVVNCMEVGYPGIIKDVQRLKKLFRDKGLELKFDPFRGEYEGKEYPFAYTEEEINIFGLTNAKKRFRVFGKYCNAGYNFFAAELISGNGDILRCDTLHEKRGNIFEGKFKPYDSPKICMVKYCPCPFLGYNEKLYADAVSKINQSREKNKFYDLKNIIISLKESINFRSSFRRIKEKLGARVYKKSPKFYMFIRKIIKKK